MGFLAFLDVLAKVDELELLNLPSESRLSVLIDQVDEIATLYLAEIELAIMYLLK